MTSRSICKQYCSIKPLTAITIAYLVSRREVGLDQPISYFIPEFGNESKSRITFRHILTHTAGLYDFDGRWLPENKEELLPIIYASRLAPGHVPGAKAAYSRLFGWQVLGRVVEVLSQRPYGEYIREKLLVPLGLLDTWVGMTNEDYLEVEDRLAVNYVSYEKWPDIPPWIPIVWDTAERSGPIWFELEEESCTQSVPAYGGYAVTGDLGRFYQMLLCPKKLPLGDLLDPSVLAEFTSVQRSGMYDPLLGRTCDYGLGFMVNLKQHYFGDYCSPRSFGHSGFSGSSLSFLDPENGIAVAILFNDVIDWETAFLRRRAVVNAIYSDLGCDEAS